MLSGVLAMSPTGGLMLPNDCPFDRDARYSNICLALHRINLVGACGSMLSIADEDDRGTVGALRYRNMLGTAGDILEAEIDNRWPDAKRDASFRPEIEAAGQVAGLPESWSWAAAHHALSCKLYKKVIVYSLNRGRLGAPLWGPVDGWIKAMSYIKSSWEGFVHLPDEQSISPYIFLGVVYSAMPENSMSYKWRDEGRYTIGGLPGMEVQKRIVKLNRAERRRDSMTQNSYSTSLNRKCL